MKKHLSKEIIIDIIKSNPNNSINQILNIIEQKYNFKETYSYVYWISQTTNIENYVKLTKIKSWKILQYNDQLKKILFKYSGNNISLLNLINIVEEETGIKYSKHILKQLIQHFKLEYIIEHKNKIKKSSLSFYQIQRLTNYCKTHNINMNHLKYKELRILYNVFQYDYLSDLMFFYVNKYINSDN